MWPISERHLSDKWEESDFEVGFAQFLPKLAKLKPLDSPPWVLRGPRANVNGRGGAGGQKLGAGAGCEAGKPFFIAPCFFITPHCSFAKACVTNHILCFRHPVKNYQLRLNTFLLWKAHLLKHKVLFLFRTSQRK